MRMLILLSLFFFFVSCDKDDSDNEICFSFDQRQCGVDEFTDLVPISDALESREEKMEEYLESKNVEIEEIRIIDNFYQAVCEACAVCPETHKFFIQIEEEDRATLESLDLFNLTPEFCDDWF